MYKFVVGNIIILIIILVSICPAGDTVHNVQPASEGNTIELIISNMTNKPLTDIKVVPENIPEWLDINSEQLNVKRLYPGQEKKIVLNFSVGKHAPVGGQQTIKFIFNTPRGINQTKEIDIRVAAPKNFKIVQNYPNPFNPVTTIGYFLPDNGNVTFAVYNMLGQQITKLTEKSKHAGYQEINWNGKDYASGMYVYKLIFENERGRQSVKMKKMALIK